MENKNQFLIITPEHRAKMNFTIGLLGWAELARFENKGPSDFLAELEITRQNRIRMAKRAVERRFKKFEPNWPGPKLVVEEYDFGDGILIRRIANPFGPAAAKLAFDSILNGYAK